MKDQSERLSTIRTRLLLNQPWYGSLGMRLAFEPRPDIKNFTTDGTAFGYNPDAAAKLTDAELTGVLALKITQCALLHPYRMKGRNPKQWSEASTLTAAALLRKANFTLPAGTPYNADYEGLTVEQVYGRLGDDGPPQTPQPQPQPPQQDGPPQSQTPDPSGQPSPQDGPPDPTQQDSPVGDLTEPQPDADRPDDAPEPMSREDWQIAADQATAIANQAGKEPGDTVRAVRATQNDTADWREILKSFVEQTIPSDYSWSRPNRRYIAQDIYLPGTTKQNTPRVAVAIDTSGSITQELLDIFGAELQAILQDTRPESLYLMYCDTDVAHTETYTPDDAGDLQLKAYGGGGTLFQPVFDHLKEQDEPPACLIYFTDLCGPAPTDPEEYPTLWITPEQYTAPGFFGETVRLSKYQ